MTENQRAWAIEEIENNILPDVCDEVAEHALGYALEALKEPPRPKGRWIKHPHKIWTYECSCCERLISTVLSHEKVNEEYPYCHCGADCRESE